MTIWRFSRSHQSAYHECPRLCWLRYYDSGSGWETVKVDLHQATGSLCHLMLQKVLRFVRDTDRLPLEADLDLWLAVSVAEYKDEIQRRGFDIDQSGDATFEMTRQAAIAEGMVRNWVELRLAPLMLKFKVIGVEEEWDVPLDPEGEVVLMVRLDALLERREDGELWPIEFKTTGWVSEDWLESFRYSSQTLQQVWATEQHTGKPCGGVLLEVLYKGVKRFNDETKVTTYYSPLVRAYIKRNSGPFDRTGNPMDADEMSWDSSCARKKGWEPVDVWAWGKVRDWVKLIPPELAVQQLFSREVFRSQREQETWVRQTLSEQRRLKASIISMERGKIEEWERQVHMDATWPARLNVDCYSNKYHRRCAFIDVCYLNADPADSEMFKPRTAHHPQEADD